MLNQGLGFSAEALRTQPLGDNDPGATMARGLPHGRGSLRLTQSPLARALLASAALSAAIMLSGCYTDIGVLPMSERAARPLSDKMVSEIQSKNMDKESAILVRTFKEESELEIWKQDRSGRFALLKTYPICRWSGELGPKIREGDRQAPEGFYNITPGQMNPNSQYYLSFDLGYPNAFDRAHGRTGAQLMVHGDCSSRGCYSMTDEQISEIYALGRDAFFGGQKSFQVQAYPFRMTPQNLAKHRTNPNMAFWKMLKKGNDHFEITRVEPKVDVCEKHYVFDAEPPVGSTRQPSFSPGGKCPAYSVAEEILDAVREKQQRDDVQTAQLIRRGTPVAPVRTNADGGMHPVFVAAVKSNQIGVAPREALFTTTPPGTIPATVRPPRIPELADAPIMNGVGPVPAPVSEPQSQLAIAEPETPPGKPAAKSGSLFGSLFSSDAAKSAEKKDNGPLLDRMARAVGLRSGDPAPKRAEAPTPKPKPAAHSTRVASHGAIRAKSAEATSPAPKPGAVPAQAEVAVPKRAPAPASAPAATAMNGAAPMVPAGTFDNRWSGFR
jgi:murein L,D-transpeptidase YafK